MEIKLRCQCGQILKVGSEAAGKTGKCPACKSTLQIPTLEEVEQARQASEQAAPPAESEEAAPPAEAEQAPPPAESEEAAPPAEEEEAPRKPARIKGRVPARSKTRSKALAEKREGKEERRKPTRRPKREETAPKGKAAKRTRGRRGRGKTSVMDKYRRRGDEEDGERRYAVKKKFSLKTLIVIGVVVVIGLVALFALYVVPQGRAVKRTTKYCDEMYGFVKLVRTNMVEKYGRADSKIPRAINTYSRYLDDIKRTAREVEKPMNRAMKKAYRADNIMHDVIRDLEAGLAIIKDMMKEDNEGNLTEEKTEEFNTRFTKKIQDAGGKVSDIDKLVGTVWKQVQ